MEDPSRVQRHSPGVGLRQIPQKLKTNVVLVKLFLFLYFMHVGHILLIAVNIHQTYRPIVNFASCQLEAGPWPNALSAFPHLRRQCFAQL